MIEKIKLLLCFVAGLIAMYFLKPSPKAQQTQTVNQTSSNSCEAKVIKTTNKKGEVKEEIVFNSSSKQEQKIETNSSSKLGLGVGIFNDKTLQLRYSLNDNLSVIGQSGILTSDKTQVKIGLEFNF